MLGLIVGLVSASGVLAAAPTGSFRGSAYGTFANADAGPVAASLGRSAIIACSCAGTDGKTLSNSVTDISAGSGGKVLTAGETVSTAFTNSTATSAIVKITSRIQGLNALNGLITASAITAVANTTVDSTSIKSNTTGTSFANLQVAGKKFSATVTANTRINLPGIGYVVLNKVTPGGNGTHAGSLSIHMIEINITENNAFDLPVGAQIVVASARSGFNRTATPVIMAGAAWGTEGNTKLGDLVLNKIGKAAVVALPCNGTDGETSSNTSAALKVDPVLQIGAVHSTAFGGPTALGTTARTTASVDGIRLLNGLITAANVTAVAQETISKAGVRTRSAKGSGFSSLSVLGTAIPNTVAPNTKLTLPSIGTVILDEQNIPPAGSDARTAANGIHVFITMDNALGLPVGSEIIVAHAHVSAKKFPEAQVAAQNPQ